MTTKAAQRREKLPDHLSDLGKLVLANCPKAYVNESGQVIDPCHLYWSEPNDPTKW